MNQTLIRELESTSVEEIRRKYKTGVYSDLSAADLGLIERAVIYRIGNREQITCKCGCHRGFINEFEYDGNIIQNTVCILCSSVVDVNRISGDIEVNEDQLLNFLGRF